MKKLMQYIRLALALGAAACTFDHVLAADTERDPVRYEVDWPSFLKKHNMVWKKVPSSWKDAPFLGNGWIGMQLVADQRDKSAIRLEVARMDAQEHLPAPRQPDISWAYARYRLPIGAFTIKTEGRVTGWDMELDLWNAELAGTVTTERGTVGVRAYVHATRNVIVTEWTATGGERKPEAQWEAYPNKTPRIGSTNRDTDNEAARRYSPGPEGRQATRENGIMLWEQPLRPSGQASTAWKQDSKGGREMRLLISIGHSYPANTASETAVAEVKDVSSILEGDLVREHRNWWHSYYPGAFLSLSDEYWEPFYWTQIYKIGAGMREDGPVLDLQGPWTCLPVNAWDGVWWNLNTQLQYWPCYTGNRLREAMSLPNTLKKYRHNLIGNVDERYRADSAGLPRATGPDLASAVGTPGDARGGYSMETGSLPWICHNLFLHYRMTMDDRFLRDDVYPLLRRAINYYLHFLKRGEDGRLHLPPTLSPEYGEAPDCNYDLSLLRWGCRTLLWSAERLRIDDPLIPKWNAVLENLVDYPVDENGYMIGRGVPFDKSHRHFSHLFMVYPLHLVDTADPRQAELANRSVLHWLNLKQGLSGYSFTAGASIYAKLHRGDDALKTLNRVIPRIAPNTLYPEPWPVMETPLATLASIHDMLLQSWNNVVHVFGAMPSKWKDAVFHNLRAEGAFLVSAERRNGTTRWIRIKSLAGEPLRLRSDIGPSARLAGSGASAMRKTREGEWYGTPAKGSQVILYLPDARPEVKPVSMPNKTTVFGLP